MGSSGSKACCDESATAASSCKRGRSNSRANRIFHSSCLGTPSSGSGSRQSHRHRHHQNNESDADSDELKSECHSKVKDEMPCISSSNPEQLDADGSSSSNNPTRFLSRFSFLPGNISFRLSRATSLGSSRAYPHEQDLHQRSGPSSHNFLDRFEVLTQCHQDTSSNFPNNSQENQTISSVHNIARNGGSNRVGADGNVNSPISHSALENIGTRLSDWRIGAREPVERNVHFSRTLSVGRLRDRVLRRSSLPDITFCPLQQEREARDDSQNSGRYVFGGDTRISITEGHGITSSTTSHHTPSSMSTSLFSLQDHNVGTSRSREARYHDLLEHRSNFLERRRRIRSQVSALQQLGSRFENQSGHVRSCILSGQHRIGHCTCHVNIRDANSNDETGTRASISRIVMLAEALFEVLDEIHQQSVVLSSQPSMSSIESIPAPSKVVESLPVKFYTRSQKYQNEEVAQCYICLVEYEEGDSVRILPCHHEFHRTCVDKWLKEIHRVCPLCRGDICKSDSLPTEN